MAKAPPAAKADAPDAGADNAANGRQRTPCSRHRGLALLASPARPDVVGCGLTMVTSPVFCGQVTISVVTLATQAHGTAFNIAGPLLWASAGDGGIAGVRAGRPLWRGYRAGASVMSPGAYRPA